MRLLSHPFRFAAGAAVTIEQDTTESTTELLGKLMLTKRGERHMVPMYGVLDPAFDTFDAGDVQLGIDLFGPEGVAVTEIRVTYPLPGVQEAEVVWT